MPTIRYYEQIGLLPLPQRAANGHRYYRNEDLERLSFIKRCRDFGFPIERVRELVALFSDRGRACVEVRDLAKEHLEQVRGKLAEMRQLEASLEASLEAFVSSCNAACVGGTTSDCVIISEMVSAGGCASFSCSSAEPLPDHAATFGVTELKRPG